MSKTNDNPAFPSPNNVRAGDIITGGHAGMTLRDYFAAKAMQGMLAAQAKASIERRSEVAYEIADAMLEARSK
jgi:hypothetical protein